MAIVGTGGRRIQGPKALPIVGGVFLGLGVAGLLVAAALAGMEWTSGRDARAIGTITTSGHGYPWVAFTTAANRTLRFQSGVRSSFWRQGDVVAVAYDPKAPQDACIDGVAGRWLLPTIFGILGCVFAVLGGGLAAAGRRLLRSGPR